MRQKHQKTIKELSTKAANIRREIQQAILDLPDNRNTKKLNLRCFTMKMSDITPDLCLSPITYDFRHQYEKLCEIIDSTSVEQIYDVLNKILIPNSNGVCWIAKERTRLHPKVVANVRKMMEF